MPVVSGDVAPLPVRHRRAKTWSAFAACGQQIAAATDEGGWYADAPVAREGEVVTCLKCLAK